MTLKNLLKLYLIFILTSLNADTSVTSTITYSIGSIDAISVSGNPAPLNITTAVAGSSPSNATNTATTYAFTTNNTARKITGSLASAMPTGVTLNVTLAAPTIGISVGGVNLTMTDANLVTGIANLAQSGLRITYKLAATVSAAQVTAATNTVTYTIGP